MSIIVKNVRCVARPSSAKIKMQMSNGVLLRICNRCVIKLNHTSKELSECNNSL